MTTAEKVLVSLIDQHKITGEEAMVLMRAIIEKESESKTPPMQKICKPELPYKPETNPLIITPNEYNPIKIWYETDGTGAKIPKLPTQYSTKDNQNTTTISWENWNNIHTKADSNPLHESRVFNRND